MMKMKTVVPAPLAAALIFGFGVLFAPIAAHAQAVSKTAMAGSYTLNLKVLPAESFTGPKPAMTRDSGAKPNLVNGPEHPNHHMVVFVRKGGKPVENAKVSIRYRELSPKMGVWTTLPVVRMHVTGHGLGTTHYGNNVMLSPGEYEARVAVNGSQPVKFSFSLSK